MKFGSASIQTDNMKILTACRVSGFKTYKSSQQKLTDIQYSTPYAISTDT